MERPGHDPGFCLFFHFVKTAAMDHPELTGYIISSL
jgi:hypothetical protein